MTNITYGNAANLSLYELERADYCEHIEEGETLGLKYSMESDSFGPVAVFIQCEDCFEHKKEQDRYNICYDCGEDKRTDQWRWFDFYAPQGDEPLEICDDCWDKPKHQQRMHKDYVNKCQDADYDFDDD